MLCREKDLSGDSEGKYFYDEKSAIVLPSPHLEMNVLHRERKWAVTGPPIITVSSTSLYRFLFCTHAPSLGF